MTSARVLSSTEKVLRGLVIAVAAIGAAAAVMTVVCLALGARPMIFTSGSMSPSIPAGSLGFAKPVAAADVAVGDVVTVRVDQTRVTHRVIALDRHGDVTLLQLKGDANAAADPNIYPARDVDRTWFTVPLAGRVVAFLGSPVGGLTLGLYLLFVLGLLGRWTRSAAAARAIVGTPQRRTRALALTTAALTFFAGGFGSWVLPTWAYWTDTASAAGTTIATGTWDVAAPVSSILNVTPASNAAGWYNANITVTLNATDPAPSSGVAGIHYKLNGGSEQVLTGASGNVPITTEGTNTLEFWAVDNAGFIETPHHTQTFKLDKTPPPAPSVTSISSDSGTSGDFITNVPAQTLTGSAEANSSVVVTKGATTLCTTAANGSGVFTCAVTLATGANLYSVTATDIAGNVSSPGTRTVTLDSTIATPTFTSISADSGVAGDRITNIAAQTLTGAADPGDAVVVKKGATTLCTTTANGSGVFTCAVTLATGTNDYVATASDVAGNTATSATFTVTLDQTTPTPTFTSISNDSGTAGDLITNAATQTLTGSAEPGATVVVKKGVTTLCTTTANGSGVFTCNVTLISGTNDFIATATDVAANTATSATYTVTLDQSLTTPTFTSISSDSGTAGDLVTNVAAQTLTGSTDPGASVVVKKGATTLCTTTANGSGAFTCNVTLISGTNVYTATATDVAANTATSANYTVTLDQSAPVLTSPLPANGANGSSWSAMACSTSANQLCVTANDTGSGVSSVTVQLVRTSGTTSCWNGTAFQVGTGCAAQSMSVISGSQYGTSGLASAAMVAGTYQATFATTDIAGNAATNVVATFTVTGSVPAAPVISCSRSGSNYTISWPTVSGATSYTVTWDDSSNHTSTQTVSSSPVVLNPVFGPNGGHPIFVVANNASGSSASSNQITGC